MTSEPQFENPPCWGFLAIDKPQGLTSRHVVDRVARLLGEKRIGHAGTLDPGATGVLLLALGPATRLVGFAQAMPKTYEGTFQLGVASDSHDLETPVRILEGVAIPSRAEIEQAAARLIGWIDQTPPAFSAVKVGGRRAYQLARAGRPVELQPRPVWVDSVEILEFDYPRLRLSIRCGRGTYIRTLGRDLAVGLGSECVMTELRRTAVGPISVEQATRLDLLSRRNWPDHRLPPDLFLPAMPRLVCSSQQIEVIRRGGNLAEVPDTTSPWVSAWDRDNRLLALLSRATEVERPGAGQTGGWKPTINFVQFWDRAVAR